MSPLALRRLDDRGSCPTRPDETCNATGSMAAAAVAALTGRFAMPCHHSEGRGSTFFRVSIRVAMPGVMVG